MKSMARKISVICAVVGVCMLLAVGALPAQAATLEWDRNVDADTHDYQVYACYVPSCVVIKSASMLQPGAVAQPAIGIKPTYVLDLAGKEGAVAVTARDLTLNESGLSVAVPFDFKAPAIPLNPLLN